MITLVLNQRKNRLELWEGTPQMGRLVHSWAVKTNHPYQELEAELTAFTHKQVERMLNKLADLQDERAHLLYRVLELEQDNADLEMRLKMLGARSLN